MAHSPAVETFEHPAAGSPRRAGFPGARLAVAVLRGVLGLAALAVTLELCLAAAFPPPEQGEFCFLDWNYQRLDPLAAETSGLMVPVVGSPRPRTTFAPGVRVRMRYEPLGDQDWFDADGSIPFVFNSLGLREREEVCGPKPSGQRRVLFLGDSVTIGWGVREEQTCCRRVEALLRRDDDAIFTVNGAAGTFEVDDYAAALLTRLGGLAPDVVVVNLTINDLVQVNFGIGHRGGQSAWWESFALTRALFARATPPALRDAAGGDWTQGLLDLPESAYGAVPRSVHWAGGGPQQALLAMQAWCRERGVRYAVVLWPVLQGLSPGESYPFARMHALVAQFCAEHAIAFTDLLPQVSGRDPRSLWVAPFDLHGNPRVHELMAPAVADLIRRVLAGAPR